MPYLGDGAHQVSQHEDENRLPEGASDSMMFDVEAAEQASEYLRQALTLLGKMSLAPSPLYYTLFYNYIAGKSLRLNKEVDDLIQQEGVLDREDAIVLFQRFFSAGGEALVEDIRAELVAMIAQVIGSLVDIAGETSLSNDRIAQHIDRLAETKKPSEVVATATAILAETRQFVTRTKQVESDFVSSVEEMHKLKAELSNAKREAAIDGLTGLYNRRAFDRRLGEQMQEVDDLEKSFCLLLIDIDHFKKINDRFGHMVGDKVLGAFAKQIGRLTRRSDFLARYGGEEFALILPDTRMTSAFTVAENIRTTLEKVRLRRSRSKETLGDITISVGVACYRVAEAPEDFIARCDSALYRAKRLGRNRTVIAD